MKKLTVVVLALYIILSAISASAQTRVFMIDGIKVIYKPTVKEVVNVRIYFRGGVTNYPQNQAGIERFALASAVECGTKKYRGSTFRDTADYYGIDIGIGAGYDYGDIDMDCITKYFDKAWDLLTDAVVNPTFESEQVDLLRSRLIANIKQSKSSPENVARMMAEQSAFAGTAYETDPSGTEEAINSFTVEQLNNYYKSILNKGQMFVVVAGNISKEDLVAKIKASFGTLPAKDYQPVNLTEPVWDKYKVSAEKRQVPINYIYALLNAPPPNSKEYLPYSFGISVLGSFLFNDLRTRLHLSYSQGTLNEKHQMPYAFMYVNTDNPNKAVPEMISQLDLLKHNLITETTLSYLTNNYITNYYLQQQSTAAITGSLGATEILGTWDLQENLAARLSQITTQQIKDALDQYIKGIRWGYVGDTDKESAMESNGDFKQ